MTKRMLIDTTHAEETRVVVLDNNRLDDYDVETSSKKQLKGNIYLAKIVRIEPSLQAAFVEYGGNRHGFLAFSEIHPDYYQIPVADRERLIALQEEEARAEEARADREDDTDDAPASDETGPASHAEHDQPDEPGVDEPGVDEPQSDDDDAPVVEMSLEIEAETVQADTETAPADDDESDDDEPGEPAPEVVGGESPDDGQAQRRTARFLRQYKIQEVMRRRQILLIQVVKEERGNKGAALTTYISLAGRFCVLMPNSLRGGGVSRKITSAADRRRLKEITNELEIPRGMGMIVRTAGAQRPRPEIRRDCEYLLRTWDDIRDTTMASTAPCLVYEEASLIKRAIRDVYTRDVEEIVVDGEAGWKGAREFMRTLMPANAAKVNLWRDPTQKLFSHYQVEHHLDAMLQPTVQLKSGGYLVINQTEALVAIDVNSGRSTRERSVEETAFRTNMEAADEVARQLRLRDLAGLIVIDFIDMDVRRNNATVERRLKDALRNDRARIQVGSISHFGLMEMSRQRLRPSIAESSFVACPHCAGSGFVRGTESSALHVLRAIEEEAGKRKASEILVHVASSVAMYVLNHKRSWLQEIEARHHLAVHLAGDDSLLPPALRIDRVRPYVGPAVVAAPVAAAIEAPVAAPVTRQIPIESVPPAVVQDMDDLTDEEAGDVQARVAETVATEQSESEEAGRRRKRRRRRRGGRRDEGAQGVGEDGVQGVGEDGAQSMGDEGPQGAGDEAGDEPGESGDGSVFMSAGGDVSLPSPVVASAASGSDGAEPDGETRSPAEEAARRGRRRRGGRNRNRETSVGQEADGGSRDEPDEASAPRATRAPAAYVGPTPADPFAGSFDIFEMIEREAETSALVPNPAASAASVASRLGRQARAPIAEPAPEVVEPEIVAAEMPAVEAVEQAVVEPEVVQPETGEPAIVPAELDASEPGVAVREEAPVVAVQEEAPAVAKTRKPRPSRARKPAADAGAAVVETPEPVVPEPVAAEPVAPEPAPAAKPRAARKPSVRKAKAAPVADDAEPAPVAEPAAVEPTATGGTDPSIVQPTMVGDAPPATRRTGWWKR